MRLFSCQCWGISISNFSIDEDPSVEVFPLADATLGCRAGLQQDAYLFLSPLDSQAKHQRPLFLHLVSLQRQQGHFSWHVQSLFEIIPLRKNWTWLRSHPLMRLGNPASFSPTEDLWLYSEQLISIVKALNTSYTALAQQEEDPTLHRPWTYCYTHSQGDSQYCK